MRTNAIRLERFVPTLDLAVALRIVGRCPNVGHAGHADELLEVLRDELRSVVGDDPRIGARVRFASFLHDGFNIPFLHFLAYFPVGDVAAAAIQHAAEEQERSRDIDVCWFGVIRKKAAIELVGDGMGNRVNDRHCTVDVDRLGTGSSSLSPFASDVGE